MRRAFKAAIVLLIATSALGAERVIDSGLNVHHIDSKNHRFFVVPSTDIVSSPQSVKAYISKLSGEVMRLYHDWGSHWVVSFFAEAQYATYKDDEQVLESVKDGTWAKAYLAEYNHEKRQITIAPLDPSAVKKYKVE
jgi:hypothetical protein